MWCHLCKKLFNDQEVFSVHIMQKHRLSSTFNEDNSDCEHSKQDEKIDSEIDENDEMEEDNSGERIWCHLCKKLFNDQEVFCVHIMQKHRLSSTFNEDNSDGEHSKQDEKIDSEIDEMEEDNSGDEDYISAENCGKSKSHINAVSPRKNTRVKRKKYKFTPRSNKRDKIHSKLSISKLKSTSKHVNKHKKLNTISKQLTNYNFIRKKPVSQPVLSVSCLNDLNQPSVPHKSGFDFNSQNIQKWLCKFKEIYKKFPLPLEPRLFNKIKKIHKNIFDNYSSTQSNEVTSAVLKVYEELDRVIDRHIISINESLK